MANTVLARWLGVAWAFSLPLLAGAQQDAAWPSPAEGLRDGRAWLQRSHDAAARRNYQGTLVTTVGGQSSSARVAHYYEGKMQLERVEPLDGEARQIIRINDQVYTLWPRVHLAVIEARDARASFPSLFSGQDRRVLDWYDWKPAGQERLAGYDAEVVLLKARDALRYSQRLWADRQTGLLLRSDVLAPNGQVLESTAFSELAIDVRAQIESAQAPVRNLSAYRTLRPVSLPVSMESEGWLVGPLPPGFREVRCARRVLGPADDPRSPTVLHTIYSDGLTHISIFVEPFHPERHQARTSPPMGATHTLMVRRDQQWITAVGDVPDETLRRVVDALSRRR